MNLPITIIIFLLFVCYLLCTANEGKLWLGTEVMNLTMQAYRLKQKQSYVVADNCFKQSQSLGHFGITITVSSCVLKTTTDLG